MMDEKHDEQSQAPAHGKKYEAPRIIRVSLRPEEAVLGHCKIAGSSGPVTASCASRTCSAFGS